MKYICPTSIITLHLTFWSNLLVAISLSFLQISFKKYLFLDALDLVGSWTCVLNEHLNEKVFKKVYSIISLIIHLQKAKIYFEKIWLSLP